MSGPHTPVGATSPVPDDMKARLESMVLEEFPSTPTVNGNGHVPQMMPSSMSNAYAPPAPSVSPNGHALLTTTTTSSSAELEENVITSSSSVMMTTTGAPVSPDDLEDMQRSMANLSHRGSRASFIEGQLLGSGLPSDVIPTAIVIKNIPFAMKRDQLITLLDDLMVPQPYALNYHFENGAFRGLAFANFRTSQEADCVVTRLDSHEVMGRKIKVEYKKVLPPEEAARKEAERRASIAALNDRVMEFDLNDPATRQLYDKMVAFRDDKLRNELIFAKSITGPERKLVRAIGQKLGFFYRTEDNGEERFFKVTRRPSVSVNKVNLKEMELDRMPRKYSLSQQPQARPDLAQILSGASLAGSVAGPAAERLMTRTSRSLSLSARDQPAFSRSAAFRKNSFMSQTPPPGFNALRQPKGPDAATNFQNTVGRKPSLNPGALPFDAAQVEAAVARRRESRPLEIVDPITGASVRQSVSPGGLGDLSSNNNNNGSNSAGSAGSAASVHAALV